MKNKYDIKTKVENNKNYIWCGVRKKYYVATPEETVRQYLIQYFIEKCGYPLACMSVEKMITINNKKLRYDIAIYKGENIWLIAECKAPKITLTSETFLQSSIYQSKIGALFLVLCNGEKTICFDCSNNSWIDNFPNY